MQRSSCISLISHRIKGGSQKICAGYAWDTGTFFQPDGCSGVDGGEHVLFSAFLELPGPIQPIHTSQAPCLQIPQVPCSKSNFLRTARVPKNWNAKWETWSAKIFVPKRSWVIMSHHLESTTMYLCHDIPLVTSTSYAITLIPWYNPITSIYSMGFFVAIFRNEFVFLATGLLELFGCFRWICGYWPVQAFRALVFPYSLS